MNGSGILVLSFLLGIGSVGIICVLLRIFGKVRHPLRLFVVLLLVFLTFLPFPWWGTYYEPTLRSDCVWPFGIYIYFRGGTEVFYLFSVVLIGSYSGGFVPSWSVPSWADLYFRTMLLPYTRLFPAMYFVFALVILSSIFIIRGELRENANTIFVGSIGFLIAPIIFYSLMAASLLSQVGTFFGGFYICLILSAYGFIRTYQFRNRCKKQ